MRRKLTAIIVVMVLLSAQIAGCKTETEDTEELGALPSVTSPTTTEHRPEETTQETTARPVVPENDLLPVLHELSGFDFSMRLPEGWEVYNSNSYLIQYEGEKDGYNITLFVEDMPDPDYRYAPHQTSSLVTQRAKNYIYRYNNTDFEYWDFVAADTDEPIEINGQECKVGVYKTSFYNPREKTSVDPQYARGFHYYLDGKLYNLMFVAPEEFEGAYELAKNILETITPEAAPGSEIVAGLKREVYTDEKYGVSFEYPAEWDVKTTSDGSRTVMRPTGEAYDPLKDLQITIFRQSNNFKESWRAPIELGDDMAAAVLSDGLARAGRIATGEGLPFDASPVTTQSGQNITLYYVELILELKNPTVADVPMGYMQTPNYMFTFDVNEKPYAINVSYSEEKKDAAKTLRDIIAESLKIEG